MHIFIVAYFGYRYTSIPWQIKEDGHLKYVSDTQAFIYSIRASNKSHPKIYPVQGNVECATGNSNKCYLIFGRRGKGFHFYHSGVSINPFPLGYASSDQCAEYKLNRYELNGKKTSFQPTEIEVFQLVKN